MTIARIGTFWHQTHVLDLLRLQLAPSTSPLAIIPTQACTSTKIKNMNGLAFFVSLSMPKGMERGIFWLTGCLLLTLLSACSGRDSDSSDEVFQRYSVSIAGPRAGHWTPGEENLITVEVPTKDAKAHVTLELYIEFAALEADTVIYLQLPPSTERQRSISVAIPNDIVRVSVSGVVDWEDVQDLTFYAPLDSAYPLAKAFDKIHQADLSQLLQLPKEYEPFRANVALRMMTLLERKPELAEQHAKDIEAFIWKVPDYQPRRILHTLFSFFRKTARWADFHQEIDEVAHTVLNNGFFIASLGAGLRHQYGLTRTNHAIQCGVDLFGRYPESRFTAQSATFFREKVTGLMHERLLRTLAARNRLLPEMMLASDVTPSAKDNPTRMSIELTASMVRGLSDSIAAMRRSYPGPRSEATSSWRGRQRYAYMESLALFQAYKGVEFMEPIKAILPTLPSHSSLAAGLALKAANQLVARGLRTEAMPFLAYSHRYFPVYAWIKDSLDKHFTPAIQPKQVDSLIHSLRSRGLIAPVTTSDVPDAILAGRKSASDATVVLFASSSCAACPKQIDMLRDFRRQGFRFNVVTVLVGTWKGNQKDRYLTDTLMTCAENVEPQYVDGLMVRSVPSSIVVDKRGRYVARFDGFANNVAMEDALRYATTSR